MSKITLPPVGSLVDVTTAQTAINNNFATLQAAIDNTLSRDGTTPNQMLNTLNMNSQRIINLPSGVNNTEPVTVGTFNAAVIGHGNLPVGGTTNQILAKNSSTDYDTKWENPSAAVSAGTNISITGTSPAIVSTISNPNFSTSVTTPSLILNGSAISGPPTGTGVVVAQNTPTLITPILGVATSTTINKVTITQPATGATLTIPDTVVLTGPAASGTAMTLGNTETVTGVKTYGSAGAVGRFKIAGTTSGSTIVDATAVASGTLTLPAATDTLVGRATVDSLSNKTLVSPNIGNATASSLTFSPTTNGVVGTPTNNDAITTYVGEYVFSNILVGSAVPLVTGTAKDVTTISLGAGDWDVWGNVVFGPAGTTTQSANIAWISTTANTLPVPPNFGSYSQFSVNVAAGLTVGLQAGQIRLSLSGTTTVSLGCLANFAVSTNTAYGFLGARRRR